MSLQNMVTYEQYTARWNPFHQYILDYHIILRKILLKLISLYENNIIITYLDKKTILVDQNTVLINTDNNYFQNAIDKSIPPYHQFAVFCFQYYPIKYITQSFLNICNTTNPSAEEVTQLFKNCFIPENQIYEVIGYGANSVILKEILNNEKIYKYAVYYEIEKEMRKKLGKEISEEVHIDNIDPKHFIVQKYYAEGTLSEFLSNHPEYSNYKLLELFKLILQIVDDGFHHIGYLVRDIKPENILIDQNYCPGIEDLDCVGQLDGGYCEGYAGTPAYMAPEVHRHLRYNAKADIYSLGCVLRFMFTGYDIPRMTPLVSPEIMDIINKMTARTPDKRPDISEIINLIDTIIDNSANSASQALDYEEMRVIPAFRPPEFIVDPNDLPKGKSSKSNDDDNNSSSSSPTTETKLESIKEKFENVKEKLENRTT